MDFKTQLNGLNQFLSAIFGRETRLSDLLASLGFEPSQIELLRDRQLEPVVSQFIASIHKRLTSGSGKDTWFQLLNRCYGLDGELAGSIDMIAGEFGFSPEYARQVSKEALQKCCTRSSQEEFKKSLRFIALGQLGKIAGRPGREHISAKLERLSNLRAAADLTRLDYEAKRLEILKQIQAELDALDVEYDPLLESANENIAGLEAEIKNDVLLHGDSVRGGNIRAIYLPGRVAWDKAGMDRYAEVHPDVLQFRKQGQPSVTLRIVEEKP